MGAVALGKGIDKTQQDTDIWDKQRLLPQTHSYKHRMLHNLRDAG